MQTTIANVDVLRQGWADAVSSLAPGVDEIPSLLEERLDEAALQDALDEESLLLIVEEASSLAARVLPPETATSLSRRLQRAVYEYLLSLDAAVPEPPPSVHIVSITPDAGLIGAEEVAELAGHQSPTEHVAGAGTDAEGAAQAEDGAAPEPAVDEPPPENLEGVPDFDEVIAAMDPAAAEEAVEPQTADADVAPPAGAEAEGDPAGAPVSRRGRFMMFRRNGTVAPIAEAVLAEPAAGDVTAAQPEPEDTTSGQPGPTFVAPRDGFHLTDHSDYEVDVATASSGDEPDADLGADPHAQAEAGSGPRTGERLHGATARGWRVRSLRKGRRRTDVAAQEPGAEAAAEEPDAELEDEETPAETLFNSDPEAISIRRQIDDRLRKRRCDDAASLMQRLAADFGGRPVADLGLDAGDRCRALGKTNAALSCYLAATRADPVYDEPLLRLADVCLDDRDVDLAVSYLERVARLHRLRNDHKGAIRVYRKIATIAPNREDILSVLMRAQATGRFDD
jgi:hypothetical protein